MPILWGNAIELPGSLLNEFLRYRYQVFVELLGWDLSRNQQLERDQFDGPDAVYGIVLDTDGKVTGGVRLLPTTANYLLADVFPDLLNGAVAPRSKSVWEVSRFACVDVARRGPQRLPSKTPELVSATLKRAAALGAEQLVSVSTLALERLLRKMGTTVDRFGPPRLCGRCRVVAYRINVAEQEF